jgi:Uma2 family endonuclease
MSTAPKLRYSPEEYLARERVSESRHQYYQGEIFAMSGGNARHSRISINLVWRLSQRLDGGRCEVYDKDMRIKVNTSGLYTYPDASVVCGTAEFEDDKRDTLLNPLVIFEVLSPSTADYDRGTKFQLYRGLSSLRDYVVVAQEQPYVEHHVKQPDGSWLLSEIRGLEESLPMEAIGCTLPLSDIYHRVTFGPLPT